MSQRQWAVGAVWPLSGRRGHADADGAAAAPLQRGERRMLSIRDTNGQPVVATDRAVYHRHDRQPGAVWTRLGWEQVDRADWDPQHRLLVLTRLTPDGPASDPPGHPIREAGDGLARAGRPAVSGAGGRSRSVWA